MSRAFLLLVLVVLTALLIISVSNSIEKGMRAEDAKKLFLEDLAQKYPTAQLREVVEIKPIEGTNGSYYQLKGRVSLGLDTPCPERLHIYYNYPPQNFVTQPPELITKNCQICINEPTCTLAFEEEAIIASHTYPSTSEVSEYIKNYPDATAAAAYVGDYDVYKNVWKVNWGSKRAPYSLVVLLSKSGNLPLKIYRETPQQ